MNSHIRLYVYLPTNASQWYTPYQAFSEFSWADLIYEMLLDPNYLNEIDRYKSEWMLDSGESDNYWMYYGRL